MIRLVAVLLVVLTQIWSNGRANCLPAQDQSLRSGEQRWAEREELVCARLMLRLLDCLVDACDTLGAPADSHSTIGAHGGSMLRVGLLDSDEAAANLSARKQDERPECPREELMSELDEEEAAQCSTRPMDLLPPSWLGEQSAASSVAANCWSEAVKWLRAQLLAARMSLLIGRGRPLKTSDGHSIGTGPLGETLAKLGQLDALCASVCVDVSAPGRPLGWAQQEEAPSSSQQTLLAFITKLLGRLADLHAQAQARAEAAQTQTRKGAHLDLAEWSAPQEPPAGQPAEAPLGGIHGGRRGEKAGKGPVVGEELAVETIYRNYAELSAIVELFYVNFAMRAK